MVKKLHLFVLICITGFSSILKAQIMEPVLWSFNTNKINNCETELILKASINEGWHLYGQKNYGEGGPPVSTVFYFNTGTNAELLGPTKEGDLIRNFEPMFGVELEYFEREAIFKQRIRINADKNFIIDGYVEYVTCNNNSCTPTKKIPFTFNINVSATCGKATAASTVSFKNEKNNTIPTVVSKKNNSTSTIPAQTKKDISSSQTSNPSVATNHSLNKDSLTAGKNWWSIFILGFMGGLAALLTPCVFPMIPMTVSFFTKTSKTYTRGITNALTYSAAIIILYVTLGLSVTGIFGSDALNALSTNIWFNLAFFILLVIFALSFLGAFEIVLPARIINKVDVIGDNGGLIGIFFMAFTLSLVSFSCTGPIIGTLLVDTAVNGGAQGPFFGMLGFSTALALPFGLFAAFPGWLNSLPKSGSWLNSVKVFLGFLELALALKFASNADLVVQAEILTREVFISIWIILFGALGIYLFGGFRFSHDSKQQYLPVGRFLLGVLVLSFTIYLIPGLWGAPLKLISGFPPPDFYSESPQGLGSCKTTSETMIDHKKEHCPNNLPCFHDYDEALAYAKKVGKPLMIDFTGWACISCRKMESKVWTVPEIDDLIRNEVVLVSLYVDDKKKLPQNERTIKRLGNMEYDIQSIGNKWSYMQAQRYKTNTQPQYILVDHNEQMLTRETSHYDPDVNKYLKWLNEGINEFKKRTGS